MANKKKQYPGFLLYFDRVEGLFTELDDEGLGYICRVMYNYARYGEMPENMPAVYALIWPTLKKMLDDDKTAYEEKCALGAYAAQCRVAEAKKEPKPENPLTYEQNFENLRESKLRMLAEHADK